MTRELAKQTWIAVKAWADGKDIDWRANESSPWHPFLDNDPVFGAGEWRESLSPHELFVVVKDKIPLFTMTTQEKADAMLSLNPGSFVRKYKII